MDFVLRKASRTNEEFSAAVATLNKQINSFKSPAAIAADPQFVYKAGELIRQLAEDKFAMSDPTDLFFERKTGAALGDWLEMTEYVNTAKVVERSLGGKPKVYTPHKFKHTITPTDWRLDFGFELERVATGQIDVGVWVDQMAEAISRYYISTALSTIDTACASGVNDYNGQPIRSSVATNVDEATVDAALKRLGDVNPNVIIAGRYSTLYPIFELQDAVSEAGAEEFRSRGAIGKYRGATLVVLRDGFNPFFGTVEVPTNRLYLVGSDKGGVLAETDMSAMNYNVVDTEEQHFRVGVKGRTAFKIVKPWRYHVIAIT